MNREHLQSLASEWVRMAKNDIRAKVNNFIREVDVTPRELAYHLAISDGEMQQILEGNGEITITTFAKLLIATGNALEIKPIQETPMGVYENMPTEEELQRQIPRPNIFERPKLPRQQHRPFIPPYPEQLHNMAERRRETPQTYGTEERHEEVRRETVPTSKFAAKSVDELTKIIRERLWDSEIDLTAATKTELVRFLDEKDKRMREYKRMKALEEDPKVNDFKNRMKKTFEDNPHLRDWAKKLLGELTE